MLQATESGISSNARIKAYPVCSVVQVANAPIFRESGWEPRERPYEVPGKGKARNSARSLEVSRARARRAIRDIALCNPFTHFFMDVVWVDIEKQGKSWVIPKNQRTVLDKAYLDYLDKLKLTPTSAGGVQSILTPKRTEEAPTPTATNTQQTGPAPVQPMPNPQPRPDKNVGTYTVIATRPQKFANGIHTTVMLQGWDQKQIAAVAMGERPELVKGVQLTGVKLELQKQDTVAFYILRDYRIVVSQDRAA